jgi:anti-sigma factor RsiW
MKDGMNNDPVFRRLLELSWRGKLSPVEEAELRAWLAKHPECQADWEAETALSSTLGQMPDAPVASNFTARVLQAVEREERSERRPVRLLWRFLPRLGFAVLAVTLGFFAYQQTVTARHATYAQSVEAVSDITPTLSPEILENYEAIRALNRTPPPDEQLLILFK